MENFRVREIDAPIRKNHVNDFVPQHVIIGRNKDAELGLPIWGVRVGAVWEFLGQEEVEKVKAAAPQLERQEAMQDVSKALPVDGRLFLARFVRALASLSPHDPGNTIDRAFVEPTASH